MHRLLLILSILPALSMAQDDPKPAVYRVDYSLRETGASGTVPVRVYSLLLGDREKGSIRTGTKIPYPTGAGPTSFSYADVGVNIDCRLSAGSAKTAALHTDFEYSQVSEEQPKAGATMPIFHQVKGTASSDVQIGQRTSVLSLDDATGHRKYELEVTVSAR